MRHIITDQQNEIFAFDSMVDVDQYVIPSLYEKGSKSFVGREFDSWDDVKDAVNSSWKQGMDVLEQYIDRLCKSNLPEIRSHKRQIKFNMEDGDEVDLDRLRSGQDYWRLSHREATIGETTATIFVDTTTMCSEDWRNILWRGAAAIALTKILEDKGYTTEVWSVCGSRLYARHAGRNVMTACCLKRPHDPLDVSTLINLVSGWFYRGGVLYALNHTMVRKQNQSLAFGHGMCDTPKPKDLDHLSRDERRVYVSHAFSFDAALGIIERELEKLR